LNKQDSTRGAGLDKKLAAAIFTALLGWLGVGPAAAQTVTMEPSAALACLTLKAGAELQPEYPFQAWKAQLAGRVKVELVFTEADARPGVNVQVALGDESNEAATESKALFVAAVKDHVRNYRVPCLDSKSGPVRLVFDYVFKPDSQRVTWAPPRDADDERRQSLLACLAHPERNKPPVYPTSALRSGLQGRVLVRMVFSAPDQAPSIEVFARPGTQPLVQAVTPWVSGYRMACHEGAPVEATAVFVFRLEGGSYGFKPLGLMQFLSSVKDIKRQRLLFDLSTMGCPFDLRLQYRQPFMPNDVRELDNRNPARRPLMRWLAAAELDIPGNTLDSVFADSTTLRVPCARLDIQPSS